MTFGDVLEPLATVINEWPRTVQVSFWREFWSVVLEDSGPTEEKSKVPSGSVPPTEGAA